MGTLPRCRGATSSLSAGNVDVAHFIGRDVNRASLFDHAANTCRAAARSSEWSPTPRKCRRYRDVHVTERISLSREPFGTASASVSITEVRHDAKTSTIDIRLSQESSRTAARAGTLPRTIPPTPRKHFGQPVRNPPTANGADSTRSRFSITVHRPRRPKGRRGLFAFETAEWSHLTALCIEPRKKRWQRL